MSVETKIHPAAKARVETFWAVVIITGLMGLISGFLVAAGFPGTAILFMLGIIIVTTVYAITI